MSLFSSGASVTSCSAHDPASVPKCQSACRLVAQIVVARVDFRPSQMLRRLQFAFLHAGHPHALARKSSGPFNLRAVTL